VAIYVFAQQHLVRFPRAVNLEIVFAQMQSVKLMISPNHCAQRMEIVVYALPIPAFPLRPARLLDPVLVLIRLVHH